MVNARGYIIPQSSCSFAPLIFLSTFPPPSLPLSLSPDYIKVRVWQGGHYHVLSRFVLSRHLRMASVSARDSLEVALAVKKLLVDKSLFDVNYPVLLQLLSEQLQARNYPAITMGMFRLTSELRRVLPLVILITGPPACGMYATHLFFYFLFFCFFMYTPAVFCRFTRCTTLGWTIAMFGWYDWLHYNWTICYYTIALF